jgi:hypothetical protein
VPALGTVGCLLLALNLSSVSRAEIAKQPLAGAAQEAYSNTISHFYFGTETSGSLMETAPGPLIPQPTAAQASPIFANAHYAWWTTALGDNVVYAWWKTSGSSDALNHLKAQWQFTKTHWTLADAGTCGAMPGTTSTAQDDAAWGAMGLIELYEATGDDLARQYAKAMLDCAWDRWHDATLSGGLWYDDKRIIKSAYQSQYALASYQYWQDTKDEPWADATYHDRAVQLEQWIYDALYRHGQTAGGFTYPNDGLYFSDTQANGEAPFGVSQYANQPYKIHMAGSVVIIEAHMAVAALEARLYAETHKEYYLFRLNLTATGIRTYETVPTNIFMNDRDANIFGFAAFFYARDVVPLLNGPIGTQADKSTLVDTAASIDANDKWTDGTYGGDWQGPVKGLWHAHGSTNFELRVSAQAATLLIAGYYASLH